MYAITFEKIKPKYAYHRGNYKIMAEILKHVNWHKRLENMNTENDWVFFEEILNHEIEENTPKSMQKKNRSYIIKQTCWQKMKKKYYRWKRFKETNVRRDDGEYKKERNILCDLTRELQKEFEKDITKH